MKKDDAKKAFTEAQKEVKENAVKKLKEFIKRTLEARERQIKIREEANRKIKILDKDIQDLKEGRIDRIEERQKADPKAKETSVAIVEKVKIVEHHHHYYDRWYLPYRFTWTIPDPFPYEPIYPLPVQPIGNGTGGIVTQTSAQVDWQWGPTFFTLNNSMAKDHAAGAYSISVNGDNEKISYVS